MGQKHGREKAYCGGKATAAASTPEPVAVAGLPAPVAADCGGKPAARLPKRPHVKWDLPDNYEVQSILGSGSYGCVCQVQDKAKGRLVAVKRIKHLFDDLVDCKRILREITLLARLRDDHIVRILEVVIAQDVSSFNELFIVMEICDSDLKQLIKKDISLTPAHLKLLLYSLLVGLRYLHSAGVYHRDLKPANCLVNQDCRVKICDFGLSRTAGSHVHLPPLLDTPRRRKRALFGRAGDASQSGSSEDDGSHAKEGLSAHGPIVPHTQRAKRAMTAHVVTRWYRAPELILLQKNYTEQIDIWSVACIYAELLQMLGDSVRVFDRAPLFPGGSCFPLSPDQRQRKSTYTRGQTDQLNVVFDIMGTPSTSDIAQLEAGEARAYVESCKARAGTGIKEKLPHIDAASLDILSKMLRFSPEERMTVSSALAHQLLEEIREISKERTAPERISLPFDDEAELGASQMRKYFADERNKYKRQASK